MPTHSGAYDRLGQCPTLDPARITTEQSAPASGMIIGMDRETVDGLLPDAIVNGDEPGFEALAAAGAIAEYRVLA